MLTTYTLQRHPQLPSTIVRDGVVYMRRTITARNVRVGDMTTFLDMTGPAGTEGTFGIGVVVDTWSTPAGSGRRYVAPWRRRTIVTRGYRGSLKSFQAPQSHADYAHDDHVEVYRATRLPLNKVPADAWDHGKLAQCVRYVSDGQYVPI